MISVDYYANSQFCQRNSVSRTPLATCSSKVVTGPFVERRTSDHQAIYHKLTKSQIARNCDKSVFSMSQQGYYTRASWVSILIHKVILLLGIDSHALSHIGREVEVQA